MRLFEGFSFPKDTDEATDEDRNGDEDEDEDRNGDKDEGADGVSTKHDERYVVQGADDNSDSRESSSESSSAVVTSKDTPRAINAAARRQSHSSNDRFGGPVESWVRCIGYQSCHKR